MTLFNTGSLRPLRPRQAAAIDAIRQAIREGHRRIVLQAPTGFGKTLTAAHIITSALQRGNRPLFTCPAITLVNQTLHHFEAEGIKDIGVIQAQHERTDFDAPVQIASVQTLIRRELPEVQIVLIDEVHQNFKALNTVLDSEAWKDKVVIGLSATPWTKGMGLRWKKLIVAATIQELIDERFLCPFDVYAPKLTPDFSKLRIKQGEFTEQSSEAIMGTKSIVADVVKTWLEKGTGDRTFLFAVNCAHAQKLQQEFIDRGVPCGYIDAYTSGDDRKEVFRKFRASEYEVIASVGCLTTGVDEDVRCIDSETEILTPYGWKGIDDSFNRVICLNPRTGFLEDVQVQKRTKFCRAGWMVEIGGGKYDLRVTDDHSMLVGTGRRHNSPSFFSASDLLQMERFRLPISAPSKAGGVCLTDDQLRFIAWFMTDGTFHHKNHTTVCIAQSKCEGKERIRKVLRDNGFIWSESTKPNSGFDNAKPITRFSVPRGLKPHSRGKGWDALAPYLDKNGSSLLLGMNSHQFKVYWEELLWGDGDNQISRTGRTPHLCVCNDSFLSSLQAMAAIAGYASNAVIAAKLKSGKTAWNLSVSLRRSMEIKVTASHHPVRKLQSVEDVWCIQNENRTLVVRRHGSVAIIGNCIIDAQPTRDEKKHVQKIGRGLRIANGKARLLILDHAGNTLRLGMVTDIHHEKLDTRLPGEKGDAYEGDAPPPKPRTCPNCGIIMGPGKKVCTFCHHRIEIDHGVDEQDGELFLLQAPPMRKAAAGLDQQDWYSGLLGIAQENGYKSRWADESFKAKFGQYPILLRKEPKTPSIAVRGFAHHQKIKWFKSRQA